MFVMKMLSDSSREVRFLSSRVRVIHLVRRISPIDRHYRRPDGEFFFPAEFFTMEEMAKKPFGQTKYSRVEKARCTHYLFLIRAKHQSS